MPPEGLEWLPSSVLLTDEELIRLIGIAVRQLGITEVRFTGGEPLLRPGLGAIVAATAALRPRPVISVTTNGIRLARRARSLREAGLDRVNVSLDTLSQETFAALARRDRLPDVLAGLSAAARTGLTPVKVNAVLMRGVNDHEAARLLRFCLESGYQLRFIEQMPLDAQHGWRRADMVTADEILTALSAEFSLTPDDPDARGAAPAETFLVDGGPGKVGVIGSVTRPFCGACQPSPADRRRPGPQLPVLRARKAICGRCYAPVRTTTSSRRPGAAPCGQAARPRHQRSRLPAARPVDVGHRRLAARHGAHDQVRFSAAATASGSRASAGSGTGPVHKRRT